MIHISDEKILTIKSSVFDDEYGKMDKEYDWNDFNYVRISDNDSHMLYSLKFKNYKNNSDLLSIYKYDDYNFLTYKDNYLSYITQYSHNYVLRSEIFYPKEIFEYPEVTIDTTQSVTHMWYINNIYIDIFRNQNYINKNLFKKITLYEPESKGIYVSHHKFRDNIILGGTRSYMILGDYNSETFNKSIYFI